MTLPSSNNSGIPADKQLQPWFLEQNQKLQKQIISIATETSSQQSDVSKLKLYQKTIVLTTQDNTAIPSVIFVSDFDTKSPIHQYLDLPKLTLNEHEKTCVNEEEKHIQYNGEHLLLREYQFDSFSNRLYLQATRANYAELGCLKSGRIDNKEYYQTGVIAPLICNDKKMLFLQRNDTHKLWSSPSGFLEPIGHKIAGNQFNLVTQTAMKEIEEEVLPKNEMKAVSFTNDCSLSLRYMESTKLPVAEFITPVHVNYSCDQLKDIIEKSDAQDKNEHIANQYMVFDFSSEIKKKESIQEFANFDKKGWFLYWPAIETLFPEDIKDIKKPTIFSPYMANSVL